VRRAGEPGQRQGRQGQASAWKVSFFVAVGVFMLY